MIRLILTVLACVVAAAAVLEVKLAVDQHEMVVREIAAGAR